MQKQQNTNHIKTNLWNFSKVTCTKNCTNKKINKAIAISEYNLSLYTTYNDEYHTE